jgi:hypothetical protein
MTREDRRAFFRRYAAGLCLITFMYVAVTILRSVRADFAPEVWSGLGYDGQPGVFTWSEMLVAAGVMIVSGSTVLIASHRRAFFTSLFIAVAGLGLVVASVAGLKLGWLGGFAFMVTSGLGLYLPYIAVHTTVFERMIALTRDRGTIGYLMYLADSAGYLGYIGLMVASTLFRPDERFLNQYLALCLVVATAGVVATAAAARWFQAHASFRGGSA